MSVRLALKIVIYNDLELLDVILLYTVLHSYWYWRFRQRCLCEACGVLWQDAEWFVRRWSVSAVI